MTIEAGCRCGAVRLHIEKQPFLSAVCYCDDCQEAGRRLETLAGDISVRDPDGGTAYVLARKDRFEIVTGSDCLAACRLSPESPTRRVVATCCNTPLFLDVTIAHWVTICRDRIAAGQRPPTEMRVMTKYRRSDLPYPDDARRYDGHTGRFFLKVLGAWVAMGFRRPKLPDTPYISV